MSIGTLTFYENHKPKEGEKVIIVVPGKGYPTGVWKGVLTYVQDLGESQIVPYDEVFEIHTACRVGIVDDRAPFEKQNCEPDGPHDVFPEAPGLEMLMDKIHEQKREVKSLKKRVKIIEKINSSQ